MGQNDSKGEKKKISREKAIKKIGKYTAYTAATMLILAPPKKAAAQSSPGSPDGW